jgi:L-erythro-3,5-diaminohexanoate dehydrogenase
VSPAVLDPPSAERIGVHRSLDLQGTLPHLARVLDASSPPNVYEAELEVETLAIDATSFADLRARAGGDPAQIATSIAAIVAERGKLQNPRTGSGGVLLGRVVSVGPNHATSDLQPGELVVPLASLIAIPLRLEAVGPVDPGSAQVPVRGRAIVTGSMLCARVPVDLPRAVALTALDVYPAASHARDLAEPGMSVLVLGAGHAGLLALAAAREALGACGALTVVDLDPAALERATEVDPDTITVQADVTDPLAVAARLAERADLTLLCTSVAGAEGAALLATAPRGTIVFFSTATTFAGAALGADALGSQPQLIIPCGLTDDRGEYAFGLLRAIPALREAFDRE